MLRLCPGVKLADGPRDSGLCYWSKEGKSFELEPKLYFVAKQFRSADFADLLAVAEHLGQDSSEISFAVEALIDLSVIENVNEIPNHSSDESVRSRLNIKKVDRYRYYLGDVLSINPLRYVFGLTDWSTLSRKVFPLMLVLGGWAVYQFYFSSGRALGTAIKSDLFFSPTIYEAFFIFTLTNFLTILYKIAIGTGKAYGSGDLYLKLLAGFNPVFDTNEDTPFEDCDPKISRYEYLYYIGAPVIARFYFLVLCILFVNIIYPFITASNRFFLSALMTTINISWMALLWQIIPSPGTLSVKALEVFKIIPRNLLGLSLRFTIKDLPFANIDNINKPGSKRYKFFLLLSFSLIFLKSLFLFLWVLPQVSAGIPAFLGDWTSQIVVILLIFSTLRFMLYSYIPKNSNFSSKYCTPASNAFNSAINQSTSIPNTLFHSNIDKNIKAIFTKRFFIIACFILFFPFGSSVAGSAIVEENMSLEIKSGEPESAYISEVFIDGPSTVIVTKDSPILVLNSDGLRLAEIISRETIAGLKADQKILEVQQKSLQKGGSAFETSLNKTEDVQINMSDLESNRKELQSFRRQYEIASSQVTRYKQLLSSGAVSELQYEDKKLEMEEAFVKKIDAQNKLNASISTLAKSKRNELIEQQTKIDEDRSNVSDELKKVKSSLAKEESNLKNIEHRIQMLTVKAPFDCVIETDTSFLKGKNIAFGEGIVSVKAVPTERVIVNIPEYSRTEIRLGDNVEVRLYSRVLSRTSGHLRGRVIRISPVSTIEDDQEQLELTVNIDQSLSDSMIGATGTAKVRTGYTCLLLNLLKPLARFVEVDLWQYIP